MSANTSKIPVAIAGTGSYLPEKVMTNKDLESIVDTSDEWITSRTGIKSRHIAAEGENTSDLATEAAKNALENAGIDAADIDLIIVGTITPDTLTPATACYVQHNLGATKALAFDVTASQEGQGSILATEVGTNGSQTSILNIPGGGSACPTTIDNADLKLASLAMQGREVFKHAVNVMKRSAEKVIEDAGLTPENIQQVIPHQANLRIIDAIADRLTIPNEKVFVNLHKYGNTSAAAVAIALDEANREEKFKRGDNIVLVGFGAGLTWAAAAIEW